MLTQYLRRLSMLLLAALLATPAAAQQRVPQDYPTIQAAIDALAANPALERVIVVAPGEYAENITLIDDLTLHGRETARTELVSQNGGPTVTAAGVRGVQLRNFTFTGPTTAVSVSVNSDLELFSNIFVTDEENVAVQVLDTSAPLIRNNTFHDNGTAISSGSPLLRIQNNIFSGNRLAVNVPALGPTVSRNCFHNNQDDGVAGEAPISGDPRYANPDALDFHLRSGSPCIDAGIGTDGFDDTQADIGAYGGAHADTVPLPVDEVEVTATNPLPDASIALRWAANRDYRLAASDGGYRVHYAQTPGAPYDGEDAGDGTLPSPIDVGDATAYTLDGLEPTVVPPAAPSLQVPEPADGALLLRWSAVAGAAGYRVHYGVADTAENELDVGNRTTYRLGGLENGTVYRVQVSAYALPTYYLAVIAYYGFGDTTQESALSEEIRANFGPPVAGLPSNEVSEFPEAVVAWPTLPDTGCFIATAAYGHYSAPQVQRLRLLRDRYLMSHAPGRAWVRWYYRHSPAAARWLERHPAAKPAVRLALLPAVAGAGLLTAPPPLVALLLASVALAGWRARSG